MRPGTLTSATHRVASHTQEGVATEPEASSSARAQDPHANTQLVQSLPRRPVREAPLRAPDTAGVRVANVVRSTADTLVSGSGHLFGAALACSFYGTMQRNGIDPIHGNSTDKLYYDGVASASAKTAVGAVVAGCGLMAIKSFASRYIEAQIHGQGPVQKAERARELGTTEACLDAAVEMVTMPEDDGPGAHLNVGEQTALAKDLLNVITAQRACLPPELWKAASNVGDDAPKLVNRLLLAARARAAQEASTSSAG
ncbi:hypothetical protein E4A48_04860 [Xanthomonas cerealis pv. cerealis]|uniref:Type III secretion system effector protein n=1 Tax=Xanthomonas cerealis pv. cerealis TaxID=152263 RepID=A0A514EBG4_9XANT|nr:type III secretion system effector XopAV [Xanthomonas translucens]QDI03113.1 hypothetical protein E4A48_04860 [Xanthomonas translucens pv. cerealis]UKE48516.1 hypothetical protein KHA79_07935 [Xanthomonas translucens pv. cerealis]